MLNYDPVSGIVSYHWSDREIGGQVGYKTHVLDGKPYRLHRIIWKWMTGEDPPPGHFVDHKNRNRRDNRWSNLRLATPSQNAHNSTRQGKRNVRQGSQADRWYVSISVAGRVIRKGKLQSEEEAETVAKALRAEFLGEFAFDHDDFVYPPGMQTPPPPSSLEDLPRPSLFPDSRYQPGDSD